MPTPTISPQQTRRRIYLMRHAEVSYFGDGGVPFEPNLVPLNSDGQHQAEAAADVLASIPLDRVVTSGLPRTVETAERVTHGRGLVVQCDERLREIQPGSLRDLPGTTAETTFVQAFSGPLTMESRFFNGETFGELFSRVIACLEALVAERDWRRLLIVAHGGVNRAILTHALGVGFDGFGHLEQDAACINIIDVDDRGAFLVRLVNFTPYNPIKIGLELTTMERLYAEYLKRVQSHP